MPASASHELHRAITTALMLAAVLPRHVTGRFLTRYGMLRRQYRRGAAESSGLIFRRSVRPDGDDASLRCTLTCHSPRMRGIQYTPAFRATAAGCVYWIPACAGMTMRMSRAPARLARADGDDEGAQSAAGVDLRLHQRRRDAITWAPAVRPASPPPSTQRVALPRRPSGQPLPQHCVCCAAAPAAIAPARRAG
jgi:hypothetical protein